MQVYKIWFVIYLSNSKSLEHDELLHDAKDLPDHLLHGGGPALVAGPAPVDAPVVPYVWLAVGADQVSITTGIYLPWWTHLLIAGWALRDQGGRRRNIPDRFLFRIVIGCPVMQFSPQCCFPIFHLSHTCFLLVQNFIQLLL